MALSDFNFTLSSNGVASGLQYVELFESGSFMYSADNSYAERVFLVDWQYIGPFITALVGYYTVSAGGSIIRGPSGSQTLPDIHPKWSIGRYGTSPPTTGLYCQDCKVEGRGVYWSNGTTATTQDPKAGYSIRFNAARVVATYRGVKYDILPDSAVTSELQRFCERRYTFNHQYATYQGNMRFCSTNNGLAAPPGKIVGQMEKTIIWHKVPSNPADPYNVPTYTTVKSALGCLNSVAFDGDVAGAVLFLGIDPEKTVPDMNTGSVYWTVAYKFAVMNNGAAIAGDTVDACAGWNYILNGYNDTPVWDLVTGGKPNAGTVNGYRIYQHYDLNNLFLIG